jgi:hypothetical protein
MVPTESGALRRRQGESMKILVQYRDSSKSGKWETKQIEFGQAPSEGDYVALVAGGRHPE